MAGILFKPPGKNLSSYFTQKGMMQICRLCKKGCACELQFCDSCIEDLSDDQNLKFPEKKKIIEKREASRKNKKNKKMHQDAGMNEEFYMTDISKEQESIKNMSEQFYFDLHHFSPRSVQFLKEIINQKSLNKNEKNCIAETVAIIESNSKLTEATLHHFMNKTMIENKQIIEALFLIEHSSIITGFFNAKTLSSLIQSSDINDKGCPKIKFLLNIGCNIKKGEHISKAGKSYIILKPEVKKRSLLSVFNPNKYINQNKIVMFPEDLMSGLKEDVIKKVIRGCQEVEDCETDENGLCTEIQILGSVKINRDVKKIVLYKKQMRPGDEYLLQAISKNYGTECQIVEA